MITIEDFLKSINYRITDSGPYCWQCFGNSAISIDSWDGNNEQGYSSTIIFDLKTQIVYSAEVYDYKNHRAYRLINPNYKQAYRDEATQQGVDPDEAFEDLKFVDLEFKDDFLEKLEAITTGKDYNTNIKISLDIPNDILLEYMISAHEEGMKFNDFILQILSRKIERVKLGNN